MQLTSKARVAFAALTATWLSACGGGDGFSTVSGTVLNHQQVAVANAEVLAVDRLSGREFNTLSDDQGRYRMVLPNGHYDLGSDDAELTRAHMVLLRTLNEGDIELNFSLPSTDQVQQISGRVFIREGIPAAGYRLVFTSEEYVSENDSSLNMETTTDEQGHYSLPVGGQRLMDVDVYNDQGEFVEFVVLHKLDGALQADITLGDASDDKRHRYAVNPGANGEAAIRTAAGDNNLAFKLDWGPSGAHFYLRDGRLPPDGSSLRLDLSSPVRFMKNGQVVEAIPSQADIPGIMGETIQVKSSEPATLDVSLRKDGTLWYTYAIHYSLKDGTRRVYFQDESGYEIIQWKGTASAYNKLNYNSKKPSIVRISTESARDEYCRETGWYSTPACNGLGA
jgi:hypothetical protein